MGFRFVRYKVVCVAVVYFIRMLLVYLLFGFFGVE